MVHLFDFVVLEWPGGTLANGEANVVHETSIDREKEFSPLFT